MFNILEDPIIRFDTVAGSREARSLPQAFAALMADCVASFPALRPHQRHAWHAFLVQLGALALHRSSIVEPPEDAARWAKILRRLTIGFPDDEPWHLVVGDITRPAFLQPATTSDERVADYKHAVNTPDELDMLLTGRNHDLKSAVAANGETDDWLYALIALQTTDGYAGAGYYGISRMNGGHGNRPAFSLAPAGGVGAHVSRDMVALVDRRYELLETFPLSDSGHSLLWTIPWDGTRGEALFPGSLDPFYIEICRRIRLQSDPAGRLSGIRATSKEARIRARELKGRTGDPWTPVNLKEGKALVVSEGGFTYRRITDYLTSGDYQPPILLKPTRTEHASGQELRLVARAIVRGQGKTAGYYERSIPLRSRVVRAFATTDGFQSIGHIGKKRIERVGIVQRILSQSIHTFLARGRSDTINREHRGRVRPWLNRLDAAVDADFFDTLQTEFEAKDQDRANVHRLWLLEVVGNARGLLLNACDSLPCSAVHRYRARTSALALFEGRMRGPKGLPFLFTEAMR